MVWGCSFQGWRERLVKVQNANTAAPSGAPQFIGWCLDKEDLCVAKLCALREKDQNFVDALISAGLVDPHLIAARLESVPEQHRNAAARAGGWLAYRTRGAEIASCPFNIHCRGEGLPLSALACLPFSEETLGRGRANVASGNRAVL
jgi:hypothetical protein